MPTTAFLSDPHFMKSTSIAEFVDCLQAKGRYIFTKQEARQATKESDSVLKLSLWRLAKKRRVKLVREGFYIMVPLEYASSGVLPPDWFIADLMKFIGQPYYVGLLAAAAIHGASHQQPQEFQVVVPEPIRAIRVGSVSIKFYTKAALRSSSVVEVKTSTGYMRVSDPAVTAIDLVAYADRIGGLDRVFTVLQELSEKITPEMLLEAAKKEKPLAFSQRLGWLLEKAGHNGLVEQLSDWVTKRKPRETPLDPSSPRRGFSRDPRWKVIVNADVEGEL